MECNPLILVILLLHKIDSFLVFFIFLKAFFLTRSSFLIALKPRGLLLSLPPEKEGKETAKGGIMFPPFEPLTKAAAAGLLRKPGKYAGSK